MGTAIIGLQWGDEGKGKVVDYLSPHHDVIVRYQGGPNAGTRCFTRVKRWFSTTYPQVYSIKTPYVLLVMGV